MKMGDVKDSKVFCSPRTQSCNSTVAGRRGLLIVSWSYSTQCKCALYTRTTERL